MSPSSSTLQAEKAMEMAEESFGIGDINMAIKHAVLAVKYDPELPVTFAYITAYMIHKAVSSRRSWYSILNVEDCTSDVNAIRRQYKKLALIVHPDKNKSMAAEGAFKHINHAWSIISEPNNKKVYDAKLRSSSSSSERKRTSQPTSAQNPVTKRNKMC